MSTPLKTAPGKISKVHKVFADEYLISFNATKSYQKAFPKTNTASKNSYGVLKRPEVIEYIKDEQEKLDKQTLITRGRIFQMLLDIYNKSMEPDDVYVAGKKVGTRFNNLNSAKGSAELMGRAIGMFADDHVGGGDASVTLAKIMQIMAEKIPTAQLGNGKATITVDAEVVEEKNNNDMEV